MNPNLLIVDDEKPTRDGLRAALEDRYEVYVAEDAASAAGKGCSRSSWASSSPLWLNAQVMQQFALTQKVRLMITRISWMSGRIRHTMFVCVQ